MFISSAIGGETIGETVEGVARYPINLRYPQQYRDSLASLRTMPLLAPDGRQITLGDVADVRMLPGPSMLKSENARPASWVYIDARGRDTLSIVKDLASSIRENLKPPAGVSVAFTGQYEMLERATARLQLMVPVTLLVIFILLFLEFNNVKEALLIMACLPFSMIGGIWFMYIKGYSLSVPSGVGFIALAGLAAEFGVIMLIYLRNSAREAGLLPGENGVNLPGGEADLQSSVDAAIFEGAVLRVRPKAMTVITTIAGLLPIFWRAGAGSEIMTRIAAPMFGGMLSAAMLSMFIVPVAYKLLLAAALKREAKKSGAAFL
jgi:Cu(I)/Ag(I) efflux system membrane protein CusA/SilA